MSNYNSTLNDNYYAPGVEDDEFDDYCDWLYDNDMGELIVDFDEWREQRADRAADAEVERFMDAMRDEW